MISETVRGSVITPLRQHMGICVNVKVMDCKIYSRRLNLRSLELHAYRSLMASRCVIGRHVSECVGQSRSMRPDK